jgi:hypothetical protein
LNESNGICDLNISIVIISLFERRKMREDMRPDAAAAMHIILDKSVHSLCFLKNIDKMAARA